MKKGESFHRFVIDDLLADVPGITSKAMFSGWGIFQYGLIFAIIIEGELYFKVDKSNQKYFEDLNSHPFSYAKKDGKTISMSYWLLPDEILEDREKLRTYIDRSVRASSLVKRKK